MTRRHCFVSAVLGLLVTLPGNYCSTINVELSSSAYPIYLGVGMMDGLGRALSYLSTTGEKKPSKIIIICDSVLYFRVKPELEAANNALHVDHIISIPGGESVAKTRQAKEKLEDALLDLTGIDRNSVLVAIGGGSIGDLVGFVAATILRGVRYIQVPTTVMSIVDSSVGGKTGINTVSGGKNSIGAFHQPSAVIVDFSFLVLLPDRHWSNGMAETIKAAFVMSDQTLWELLKTIVGAVEHSEQSAIDYLKFDNSVLQQVLVTSIEYKVSVVQRDEKEVTGIRSQLNFGHTIGHAIEMTSEITKGGNALLHGECVSIGMVFELKCLQAVSDLPHIAELEAMLTAFGLPVRVPADLDIEMFSKYVIKDKKRVAEQNVAEITVPIVAMRSRGTLDNAYTVPVGLHLILRNVFPQADLSREKIYGISESLSQSVVERDIHIDLSSDLKPRHATGPPVGHSLPFQYYTFGFPLPEHPVPFIHNLLFGKREITAFYSQLRTNDMDLVLKVTAEPRFRGAMIAEPFKEKMYLHLDKNRMPMSKEARLAGAVNMVVREGDRLFGHNAEVNAVYFYLGYYRTLHNNQRPLSVLVIGTNGFARAAIAGALRLDWIQKVSVIGKDVEGANSLLSSFSSAGIGLSRIVKFDDNQPAYDVIIGCLRNQEQAWILETFPNVFHPNLVGLIDFAYYPAKTKFMQIAATVLDSPAFSIINGKAIAIQMGDWVHKRWVKGLIAQNEIAETKQATMMIPLEFLSKQVESLQDIEQFRATISYT